MSKQDYEDYRDMVSVEVGIEDDIGLMGQTMLGALELEHPEMFERPKEPTQE